MGNIQIETPLVVCADDYHEFRHILGILNLSSRLFEGISERSSKKPEAKLYTTKKAPDGDYHYERKYHAIIYLPGVDDEAAAQLAAEIEATLEG